MHKSTIGAMKHVSMDREAEFLFPREMVTGMLRTIFLYKIVRLIAERRHTVAVETARHRGGTSKAEWVRLLNGSRMSVPKMCRICQDLPNKPTAFAGETLFCTRLQPGSAPGVINVRRFFGVSFSVWGFHLLRNYRPTKFL